jgi:hypothetical protein
MKRKETVNIIRRRFKKINTAFRSLPPHFNAQDIHVFRVEVKKLKAFLRFTGMEGNKSDKGSGLKLPKKLRDFYKITGDLRNLQLQDQNIRKSFAAGDRKLPHQYLDLLSREVAGNIFLAELLVKNKKNFKKEQVRIIARLPTRTGKRSTEKFMRSKTEAVQDLLTLSSPTDESFHSVRKSFKDLLYTQSYTEDQYALQQPLPPAYSDIGSLADQLGDLQDLRIGVGLLQPAYTDKVIPEKERIDLLDLRGQWQEEKQRKELEIYALLKENTGTGPGKLSFSC